EKRRETARDGLVHGLRGGGDLPDVAAVFVEICPSAYTLACHRERIVRKRSPAGRCEILRPRERIALPTADPIGQSVAQWRDLRTGRWRATNPIQANRLDGVGAAGSEPIDAIRRSLKHGHGIVLVAQPVDQRSAVDDDIDILAGGRVLDGCRQGLRLELVDQSGKGLFEMRMGGMSGSFRCASLKDVVKP